jgi:indolepyruvate ferredoxin oxidoreductase
LSVHPVDTELGRKTQLDQTSCNTDYSCLDGDCPSFVTIEAKPGRSQRRRASLDVAAPLEPPARITVEPGRPFAVVAVGIGGTGVVTLNQIVATAAWAEGLRVRGLDQTGLSQKGGPVVSHLVLSTDDEPGSNAVGSGGADLYLALDPVAAVDQRFIGKLAPDRTATVATTTVVPTIGMVVGDDAPVDTTSLLTTLAARSRPDGFAAIDAAGSAEATLGDASTANVVALGTAYQRGWLPISGEAIEAAICANGVAVDANLTAFRLGRRLATDADTETSGRAAAMDHQPSSRAVAAADRILRGTEVPAFVRRRAADLVDYQGVRLAQRYVDLVTAAAAAERRVDGSSTQLADAVAAAYFKLLAYKDEYEVARLHLLPEFRAAVDRAVPDGTDLRYLLHPPVLRAMGMGRKLALPARVAEPTFRALRAMRRVRGTPLDVFGRTEMRRLERRLADDYERDIRRLLDELHGVDLADAASYAALPLEIRGYETVKQANVERYERERAGRRATLGAARGASLI